MNPIGRPTAEARRRGLESTARLTCDALTSRTDAGTDDKIDMVVEKAKDLLEDQKGR